MRDTGFAGLVDIFHGEAGAGGLGVWFFWLAAAWAAEFLVSVAIDFLIWWSLQKESNTSIQHEKKANPESIADSTDMNVQANSMVIID